MKYKNLIESCVKKKILCWARYFRLYYPLVSKQPILVALLCKAARSIGVRQKKRFFSMQSCSQTNKTVVCCTRLYCREGIEKRGFAKAFFFGCGMFYCAFKPMPRWFKYSLWFWLCFGLWCCFFAAWFVVCRAAPLRRVAIEREIVRRHMGGAWI